MRLCMVAIVKPLVVEMLECPEIHGLKYFESLITESFHYRPRQDVSGLIHTFVH